MRGKRFIFEVFFPSNIFLLGLPSFLLSSIMMRIEVLKAILSFDQTSSLLHLPNFLLPVVIKFPQTIIKQRKSKTATYTNNRKNSSTKLKAGLSALWWKSLSCAVFKHGSNKASHMLRRTTCPIKVIFHKYTQQQFWYFSSNRKK